MQMHSRTVVLIQFPVDLIVNIYLSLGAETDPKNKMCIVV